MGRSSAAPTRMPKLTRNTGLSTLPTQVRIPLGRRENTSTTPKKISENTARAQGDSPHVPSSGCTPTENGTVAQRGTAKNGPMVRYSAQVKNTPYRQPTRLLSSARPPQRLMPNATTPNSGRPTPVTNRPITAGQRWLPACCPIETGKIRFPAPKNRPNSILVMVTVSRNVRFFFIHTLQRAPQRSLHWIHCIIFPHR